MLSALSNCILKIEGGVQNSSRPEDRLLGEKFLSSLAPILASSEVSTITIERLQAFERLVGNSFLIDPEPFGNFYQDWNEYKEQCEQLLILGMTGNERIYALGLMNDFDRCVKDRNWIELRHVLRKAHFDEQNIEAIIHQQQNTAEQGAAANP